MHQLLADVATELRDAIVQWSAELTTLDLSRDDRRARYSEAATLDVLLMMVNAASLATGDNRDGADAIHAAFRQLDIRRLRRAHAARCGIRRRPVQGHGHDDGNDLEGGGGCHGGIHARAAYRV